MPLDRGDWYKLHYVHLASYLVGGLVIGVFTPRADGPIPLDRFFLPFGVAFALVFATALLTFPAYYVDARYLRERSSWTPPWKAFVAISVVGTPLLGSAIYVWKRKKAVPEETGIPFVGKVNWFSLIVLFLLMFGTWWIAVFLQIEPILDPLFWPIFVGVQIKPIFYYLDAKDLKRRNSEYEPYWYLYAVLFLPPGPAELIYTIQRTRHTVL